MPSRQQEPLRPYISDSSSDIADRGLDSLDQGDQATFDDCLRELRRRTSRAAKAFARELEVDLKKSKKPRSRGGLFPGSAFTISGALRDVVLLTDNAIVERRTKMLREAKRSVWLSTYTFDDRDSVLSNQLCRKAADGVRVALFGSLKWSDRDRVEAQREKMERARIHVYQMSSHSKCVVCDDESVQIGSANLNKTHRDLALFARSAALAAETKRYLESLKLREKA